MTSEPEVRPPSVEGDPQAGDDAGTEAPERIERELVSLRVEVGDLVGELDRRRRRALDLPLQLRRYRATLVTVAAVAALAVIGTVAWRARERRRRREPLRRARGLAHALALVARDPERLTRALEESGAPRPSPLTSLVTKLAGSAGGRVVAHAITHGVQ